MQMFAHVPSGQRPVYDGGAGAVDGDLAAEFAALRARVERLETALGPPGRAQGRDPLAEVVERRLEARPEAERAAPAGQLQTRGLVRVGESRTAWSGDHDFEELLALPSAQVARSLTGLAHPVRIEIWKALLPGPKDSHALLLAAGLNTTGQLYHHLREMESVGLIQRRGRNLWAHRAIPTVALALVAAADLAGGRRDA